MMCADENLRQEINLKKGNVTNFDEVQVQERLKDVQLQFWATKRKQKVAKQKLEIFPGEEKEKKSRKTRAPKQNGKLKLLQNKTKYGGDLKLKSEAPTNN